MSKIFIITAPSGAGKTTIAQNISISGEWVECISHTTRKRRDGEVDGKTYYFVNEDTFNMMSEEGKLAESVIYNGNHYGISNAEIKRVMDTGRDVFIIAEYGGYIQIKAQYPDAIGIFLYMSKEDCMANMLLRGDKLKDANERIKLYDDEIQNSLAYDYVVRNVRDKQHETENIVRAIIRQYRPNTIFMKNTNVIGVGGITSKDSVSATWNK